MIHASRALPEVCFIALGGTISSTSVLDGGVVPTLSADRLLASVPGLASIATVRVLERDLPPMPGAQLTLEMIVDVAAQIARETRGEQIGTVVSQGTDTLEETAFALDLLLPEACTVVVTGAMRDPTLLGADGAANLLAAVCVAAAPSARGLGTLVVLGDQVHAARYVRKLDTSMPSAFGSPIAGPLGSILENRVIIRMRPRRHGIADLLPFVRRVPKVALLVASLGDGGELIDAVEQCGYEGLVFEAFGGGHVSPRMADRLAALAARIPVVIASRVGSGSMLRRTYSFVGSERDLCERGLPSVDDINGPKARILLSFLIGAGLTRDEIALRIGSADLQNDETMLTTGS